jgi:hypothetical protein
MKLSKSWSNTKVGTGSAAKWQRKAFCSSWIMQSPQLPKRLNAGRPAGEANVGMFFLAFRSRFSIAFVEMRSSLMLWPSSRRPADFGQPVWYASLRELRGGPKPLASKRWSAEQGGLRWL